MAPGEADMTGMNTMAMTTRSIETRAQIQGNPAIQPNMHVLSSDDAGGVIDFILGAPKSLQMVTEALRLKDACSLEEKL